MWATTLMSHRARRCQRAPFLADGQLPAGKGGDVGGGISIPASPEGGPQIFLSTWDGTSGLMPDVARAHISGSTLIELCERLKRSTLGRIASREAVIEDANITGLILILMSLAAAKADRPSSQNIPPNQHVSGWSIVTVDVQGR